MTSDALQEIHLERIRHDRSYLPLNCLRKALRALFRYFWFRLGRRPDVAVNLLMNAHRQLVKGWGLRGPAAWLRRIVEECIRWEFRGGTRACLHISSIGQVSEYDVKRLNGQARSLVLKAPRLTDGRVLEKGVLLLKPNEAFHPFASCVDMDSFLHHYVLVLEPSWSVYANPNILLFTRYKDQPIVVMASEELDYQFLKNIKTNLIPVAFGSSDWVNPSIFRPLDGIEKIYDAVMVARWAPYKRHHVLFRALRQMNDHSFTVALVADLWPSTRGDTEHLIRDYGVTENITIYENLSLEGVNKIFNQSKVNLLLSLQEGGNKSIFEGFFAGIPGLALKNNIGIRKSYFTPETGRLISEKDLVPQLSYFKEHWKDFNPRPWAIANISPEVTTAKLNSLLKDLAFRRGEEWTADLVAKSNCPGPKYYPDESVGRRLPTMKDLMIRYAKNENVRNLIIALWMS